MDYGSISAQDVFLSCLRSGDESAWAEFISRFEPLILRTIIKVATHWGELRPQTIDELLQETYLKLCADRQIIVQSFRPTHPDSVYGYIRAFAGNLAQDHFKAAHASKRGGSARIESVESLSARSGEAPYLRSQDNRIERDVLLKEIEGILVRLVVGPNAERDKLIFWLYFRSGLAASAIAVLPSIDLTTKGVESTLQKLTTQLKHYLFRSELPGEKTSAADKGMMAEDSL